MSAACSGCHAPIVWGISTASGSRMPCNPDPVLPTSPGQQLVVGSDRLPLPAERAAAALVSARGPVLRTLSNADLAGLPADAVVLEPHWASCPARQRFKRPPQRK